MKEKITERNRKCERGRDRESEKQRNNEKEKLMRGGR